MYVTSKAAWHNLCIKMSEIAEHIFSITENKCLRDVPSQDQPSQLTDSYSLNVVCLCVRLS